jgi:hypothetical protein
MGHPQISAILGQGKLSLENCQNDEDLYFTDNPGDWGERFPQEFLQATLGHEACCSLLVRLVFLPMRVDQIEKIQLKNGLLTVLYVCRDRHSTIEAHRVTVRFMPGAHPTECRERPCMGLSSHRSTLSGFAGTLTRSMQSCNAIVRRRR